MLSIESRSRDDGQGVCLEREQFKVVRAMLGHGCTCVMRSKVEPMKEVAARVRRHLLGIVAGAQTRQTNGFVQAIDGLLQAAKRRAPGYPACPPSGPSSSRSPASSTSRRSTLMPANPPEFQESFEW